MKIFENIKNEKGRTVKLFGWEIFASEKRKAEEAKSDGFITRQTITKRFFGGIVQKVSQEAHILSRGDIFGQMNGVKETFFCGLPVIKKVRTNTHHKSYFFNRHIKTADIQQRLWEKYAPRFNDYDDIYILHTNMGEASLVLAHRFNAYLAHNGSKNPLFITTKKYHQDLLQMFVPEIPSIEIQEIAACPIFQPRYTSLGHHRFFNLAPSEYWAAHLPRYFDTVYDYHFFENGFKVIFGLKQENTSCTFPRILSSVQNSMLDKTGSMGLMLDNFVFLAPFAQTYAPYPTDFWLELCRLLCKNGIDVFLNLAPSDPKEEYSELLKQGLCKSCSLSLAEAYALAKKSKSIIGLRSGLMDLFTLTQVPMYVIYTRTPWQRMWRLYGNVSPPTERFISIDTLVKMPGVNPGIMMEYNTEKMSSEEIRRNILDALIPEREHTTPR
ncbi:MAG: hypothetical protein LBT46_10940 [Planctomycetaceae bacterium]|jgi:ADP-heptose:LPS heptosyltransferase|nr:hypothetical protein [Planctomycetaceae bacterium]